MRNRQQIIMYIVDAAARGDYGQARALYLQNRVTRKHYIAAVNAGKARGLQHAQQVAL